MPLSYVNRFSCNKLQPQMYPDKVVVAPAALVAGAILKAGTIMGYITATAANDVWTLTPGGTVSAGTLSFTYAGAPVTINATDNAAAVATKINAALVAQWGQGNGVTVTGGPLTSSPLVITAAGTYVAQPQTLVVTSNALTGSSPTLTATHTTTGIANGAWNAYASGNSDGTQVAKGILQEDVAVDPTGRISYASSVGAGLYRDTATGIATTGGQWNTSELIGLDTTAVSALGALVSGTLANGILELNG